MSKYLLVSGNTFLDTLYGFYNEADTLLKFQKLQVCQFAGQSTSGWIRNPSAWSRCVGTCLLSQVSESPSRVHCSLVVSPRLLLVHQFLFQFRIKFTISTSMSIPFNRRAVMVSSHMQHLQIECSVNEHSSRRSIVLSEWSFGLNSFHIAATNRSCEANPKELAWAVLDSPVWLFEYWYSYWCQYYCAFVTGMWWTGRRQQRITALLRMVKLLLSDNQPSCKKHLDGSRVRYDTQQICATRCD